MNIYVYLFDDIDSLETRGFSAENMHRLPAFRRQQCEKYRRDADKNACILAYLLLVKGLREQYSIPPPPAFVYNEHGKPYLETTPHVFFNFSHCRQGVVCALSEFEVGVDIQDIRPFTAKLADRVCSDEELSRLDKCDDPEREFCKFWAMKESYAKAKGVSIADVLKRELPDFGFATWEFADYYVSLFHHSQSAKVTVNLIKCELPI